MALNIGSMYASLAARTGAWSKGLQRALGDLERFSREAKKVSADVAQFSGVLAGVGIAAVKLASGVDGPTKRAMNGLEQSTKLLAVQVADMLLPAVRELTAMFRQAAGVVAGLDPEMKKHVSNFAILAVQVAFAAKAFSLFAGVAGSAFGVLKGALGMISAIGLGPIIGIALALGTVVAVVVLLHRAWRKNWGGIQDATAEVLNWLHDGFSQFANFIQKVWGYAVKGASVFVDALLNVVDAVQNITGKKMVDTGALREGFAGLWKDLQSGSFFSEAFSFGKTVGQQIVDGLSEELSLIKKELGLDKLFSPSTAKPIGLGRGMPQGPAKSGAANDALTQAMRSTVNVQPFVDEANKAAREMSQQAVASEVLRQEMKRRLAAEKEAAASAQRMAMARVSGDTSTLSKAERRDFNAENTTIKQGAVEASSWGEAQRQLRDGLKGAYSVGAQLEVWGRRMGPMVASMGKQLLGAVGELVGSIVEGAQSGGIWGAIIAAFMEIAKKTASALQFLGVAMEFIEQIAAMIEPLVKPIFDALTNVLGVVTQIVAPVFEALKPLFENIGKLVNYLAPILYAVGDVLMAIAPVLEVIGKVVGVIFQALRPIIELIAGILKVVATVLLGIIIALNELAASFGDEAAKAESAKMKALVEAMWSRTAAQDEANMDLAGSTLKLAAAQNEAAESAQKVATSLSNVPNGYRIAHARYQADMGLGAQNLGFMAPAPAGSNTTIIFNGDITTDSDTLAALSEDARREAKRRRGQRSGNPTGEDP
jgi:hypothetical protein